jgi:hypothetical protein
MVWKCLHRKKRGKISFVDKMFREKPGPLRTPEGWE